MANSVPTASKAMVGKSTAEGLLTNCKNISRLKTWLTS